MINRLKAFLSPDIPVEHTNEAHHMAAACLLVEAAYIDGEYGDEERHTIVNGIVTAFDLNEDEAHTLVTTAEAEMNDTVELYKLSKTIKDNFTEDERKHIIALLWEVILADGVIDAAESNLMRRICGLIYITDRDSGLIKQQVMEKLAS